MLEILTLPFCMLLISFIMILFLLLYVLHTKNRNQLKIVFTLDLICVFIICFGVIVQVICNKLFNVPAIFFENFIYIGTCFLPVCVYFTGLILENTKLKLNKFHLLLLIVPLLTLIILWTNNIHHCFTHITHLI